MRKSIAEDVDEEPDDPIEASDSSKPTGRLDGKPSGVRVWQRTETSLAVRDSVENDGLSKVRLKKATVERGGTERVSGAAQRVGELSAIIAAIETDNQVTRGSPFFLCSQILYQY